MKKLIIAPAALALVLTAGSGAFAASAIDLSLYEEASPYAVAAPYQGTAHDSMVNRETQQASTAPVAAQERHTQNWGTLAGKWGSFPRDPE